MSQRLTVITPFSRIQNLPFLLKVLEGKCNWILLQHVSEETPQLPEWVLVKKYDVEKDSLSNRLLNEFFKKTEDDEQYMVLCDDDSVEEGFFDKIPNADVVCVSMKRNDFISKHVVWDDWTTKQGHWEYGEDILYANPDNMRIARVGGEQLICKGKVLKQFQYGLEDSTSDVPGDFSFIRDVMAKYPITFIPDAYVYFNYFEDGRWKGFRRNPVVLFVGDYYCAGVPQMGISEWETNLWKSLEATGLANVARFHFDKYYYHTGNRADTALIERLNDIKPDYVVLIIYKQHGHPTAPMLETIEKIGKMTKLITIWGDLEAEEQRSLAQSVERFCYKMIGTANKEVVEGMGYTYMHVPKDPRIFNNHPDASIETEGNIVEIKPRVRDLDVVFSGSFGRGREERQEVLKYLIDNGVNLTIGGSEGGDHFTTEEYAQRYKRAKIAISFSQARGMNVVNARPFEVMNCGAMLLEQKSEELAKLYEEGKDYDVWTTKEDLLEKIRYYLNNDEQRLQISHNGWKKTTDLYSAETFWKEALK